MKYRIIYGFRIEIYDAKETFVLSVERSEKRYDTMVNSMHYEPIAKKVSTSIPQIRRDFTERFTNGLRYLEAAGRKFDQPTHYARKIMELQELYEDHVLDTFIGIAVDENKMDIQSFRLLLRQYNSEKREFATDESDKSNRHSCSKDHSVLTRDCSYYELATKEELVCSS